MPERGGPRLSQQELADMTVPLLTPSASMTRRAIGGKFLKVAGAVAAGRLLTACGSPSPEPQSTSEIPTPYWAIRSVDTMKQSRDEALVILQAFNQDSETRHDMRHKIDQEVQNIAALTATHVAIGTPYDERFLPVAKAYIASARKHGLNIWWRGNFSAYDLQDSNHPEQGGWFDTPHNPHFMQQPQKISQFIDQYGDWFKRGDIFMPWPEPENVVKFYENKTAYHELLLAEYEACHPLREKGVLAGNCSMNGDVAKLLDPKVVKEVGNIVIIDHYVPEALLMGQEIDDLHNLYPEAHIIVGEFGTSSPPDSPQEQANFVAQLFDQMKRTGVIGMNYWVDIGGDTELEESLTKFRPVYYVVGKNYGASAKSRH
jgi:hypothetical protein